MSQDKILLRSRRRCRSMLCEIENYYSNTHFKASFTVSYLTHLHPPLFTRILPSLTSIHYKDFDTCRHLSMWPTTSLLIHSHPLTSSILTTPHPTFNIYLSKCSITVQYNPMHILTLSSKSLSHPLSRITKPRKRRHIQQFDDMFIRHIFHKYKINIYFFLYVREKKCPITIIIFHNNPSKKRSSDLTFSSEIFFRNLRKINVRISTRGHQNLKQLLLSLESVIISGNIRSKSRNFWPEPAKVQQSYITMIFYLI